MRKALILGSALIAGCAIVETGRRVEEPKVAIAAPAQNPAQVPAQNSVENYRYEISAEVLEALRSEKDYPLPRTFLAIDFVELQGDKALKAGASNIALMYYRLALSQITRWLDAYNNLQAYLLNKPINEVDELKILKEKFFFGSEGWKTTQARLKGKIDEIMD